MPEPSQGAAGGEPVPDTGDDAVLRPATTLTYWNGRGLCATTRLMLAFTGEEYEESVPGFDGVTHLSEPEHMQYLREEGMLLWNQVPLLCIDGLELVQSKAQVRYLAEKHNLRGSTPAEVAMCDMLAEGIADWKGAIGLAFEFTFGAHAQSKEQRERTAAGNAKYLPMIERRLVKNNTGLLVGSTVTYADVLCFEVLDLILTADEEAKQDGLGEADGLLDNFPMARGLYNALLGEPRIAAFLASDRHKSKTQDTIESYKSAVIRTLSGR